MKILTLDFETYWCTKTKYALTKMTQEAYIRDPRFHAHGVGLQIDDGPVVYVKHEQIPAIFAKIDWDDTAVLGQNTAFDGFILTEIYNVHPKMWLDTKSMFMSVYPHERASLKNISKVLNLPSKGEMKTDGIRYLTDEQQAELGEYCKQDVLITKKAWDILKPSVPVHELRLIDETIRWAVEPKLRLDKPLLEEALKEEQEHKAKLLELAETDKTILASNPKFADLLRSLGVEPPIKVSPTALKKDKNLADLVERIKLYDGKLTIEACEEQEIPWAYAFGKSDVEFKALLDHEDPAVVAAVEARMGVKSTIKETRTERLIGIADRGTLPIPLIYWGAATGRWSASGGINMQNLPRGSKLRDAIVAPEGYSLVVCDLSAIEARVLAWVAGQDDVLDTYRNRQDLYCRMASSIYGREITKENKNERQVGKTAVLGAGYGMSWRKFVWYAPNKFSFEDAKNMGVNIDWFLSTGKNAQFVKANCPSFMDEKLFAAHCACCHHIILTYRDFNARIETFWRETTNALLDIYQDREVQVGAVPGLITTCKEGFRLPRGRFIRYTGLQAVNVGKRMQWSRLTRDDRSGLHGGLVTENLVQGLARHIMADQLLECLRSGLHPVFTCHDEIVLCELDELAEEALRRLETIMSTPPEWAVGLPLACEGGISKTYGGAK